MLTNDIVSFEQPSPGKLSQVPPAEELIIGCDRRQELPVNVEK